ncbi:MAG TPA: hypothetical protein VIH00_00050 [Candidatus Limnocylindrales bacterium]
MAAILDELTALRRDLEELAWLRSSGGWTDDDEVIYRTVAGREAQLLTQMRAS